MNRRVLKTILLSTAITLFSSLMVFGAKLDPTIPSFDANRLDLSADGTATFVAPTYADKWKRFDVQLLRRVMTSSASTGVVYTYKTHGGIQHVDPEESEYTFTITSTGYYQFQIRGVNLEGNYGEWIAIYDNSTWSASKTSYPGVPVSEDDISPGGGPSQSGSGIGSGYDYNYGPGVVNQGYLPYGYQYAIIGPNGQVLYNYGNNNNYQQQGIGMQYGPGYTIGGTNNGTNNLYPNTGVSNYQQVPSPYGDTTNNQSGYNYNNQSAQVNQNSQTNPNYYNGNSSYNNSYSPNVNNSSASPQITQGLEIGWHVDANGRFYYQGNGAVLRGTWYLIDGSYYRFSDNGYILVNQWFQDNSNWYYLGGDGRMLLGWQCINGTWYYFKPQNGNGYGTMYRNTTLQITDGVWGTGNYAFDANGATVMNAWYGGYYYGRDGKRTN